MVHGPKGAPGAARPEMHKSPIPPPSPLEAPAAGAPEAPAAKPTRITVGDRVVPRLAPYPKDVRDLAAKLLNYIVEAGVTGPYGGTLFPVDTHRSVEAAAQALAAAPLVDRRGRPAVLAQVAVVRPGIGNFGPSAAFVFRLSRYFERVIVAYGNGLDARFNHLRPAMAISGVAVPPELRGRLLEIGKPDRLLLSLEQASDLFVEQFGAMRGSPLLADVDPLSCGAVVFAHSTGGLDATLTRRRLAEAGFASAVGRLVAIATPFKGSTTISETLTAFINALAGQKMNSDEGRKAVRSFDPRNVPKRVPREAAPLVDVSLAARIGQPCKFRKGKKGETEAIGNAGIRPVFRFLALAPPVKTIGDLKPERVVAAIKAAPPAPLATDGLVPVESTKFGKKSIVLSEQYDHASTFEDPAIVERAVKALLS